MTEKIIQHGITWIDRLDGGFFTTFALPHPFRLSEKIQGMLTEKAKEFGYPFEGIMSYALRDGLCFYAVSICHPEYDEFNLQLGIDIAVGRLTRLIEEGYKTWRGEVIYNLPEWVDIIREVEDEPTDVSEE